MQAMGTWKGGFESLLEDGRAHTVTVDLPVNEGGHSAGTSPLELCVLSLAGCITTTFALIAHKRHLSHQGMSVALEAERPPGSRTISRVHGTVRIRSKSDRAEVETALRLTLQTCPVGVIFEGAHIPVDVHLIISSGPVAGPMVESSPS